MPVVRLIAFYLPQFFPIPENDLWWGKGFTEWTNVAKARPLFPGHRQPRLPADLGFYDLRVPETRMAQARMARDCGVEGFCYWHYWFGNGRRILERPFDEVLAAGSPDFPFCLAWANQSWSGVWHGAPGTTLIEQTYPGRDDEASHFHTCLTAFRDPRYMRVDGRPIFVIYAPHDLPSTSDFVVHWRSLAEQNGLPGLFFIAVGNVYDFEGGVYHHPVYDVFDAITPHTPQDYLETTGKRTRRRLNRRLRELNGGRLLNRLKGDRFRRPTRIDYADVVAKALEPMPQDEKYVPCVLPNWDNTPRSGHRGVVYEGSTPALFKTFLQKAVAYATRRPPNHALIFLKSWNEWAEGNYVEPDATFGHAYLDVIRDVIGAPDAL